MLNFKCPVYRHCEGNGKVFNCTYARRGKQYKSLKGTPNCYKDTRRESTIEKAKAKEVKKPNIWD